MPDFGVPEATIARIVRLYRQAIESLATEFIEEIDLTKPRAYALMRSMLRNLDELDDRTGRWAERTIPGVYRDYMRGTATTLRRMGFKARDYEDLADWAGVHKQALSVLLYEPTTGFIPLIRDALGQIRGRLLTIEKQAKVLQSQQRMIDEIIASEDFMKGLSLEQIRDKIVREILRNKPDELYWTNRAASKLAPENILRNMADLPYVKLPDKRALGGFRRVRLDRYVEMLARTKASQAASLGEFNTLRSFGQDLAMVSRNAPLVDDICWLFVGRVFAMTKEAAERYGVPHFTELPNGTPPPWHPNCRHIVLPFVPGIWTTPEEIEYGMRGRKIPAWGLNTSYPEANRAWRKHGGVEEAGRLNQENIEASTIPRPELREKGSIPSWLKIEYKPHPLPKIEMSKENFRRRLTSIGLGDDAIFHILEQL